MGRPLIPSHAPPIAQGLCLLFLPFQRHFPTPSSLRFFTPFVTHYETPKFDTLGIPGLSGFLQFELAAELRLTDYGKIEPNRTSQCLP